MSSKTIYHIYKVAQISPVSIIFGDRVKNTTTRYLEAGVEYVDEYYYL